jgi:hypothetical protein
MSDPHNDPNGEPDLVDDMREEIVGMAKEGMHHPSTTPVLVGAAAGAVAGWVLPFVGPIIGGLTGAGITLYSRIKR